MALVRKIIAQSTVDGQGNRTAIFLQGCNIRCAYCHNPETQAMHDPEAREMSVAEVMDEVRKEFRLSAASPSPEENVCYRLIF